MTSLTTLRTTLAAYADDLEFGTGDEVTVGYLLRTVLIAMDTGRLRELEDAVEPVMGRWTAQSKGLRALSTDYEASTVDVVGGGE